MKKAQKLGFTSGKRGRPATLPNIECLNCKTIFKQKLHSQKYCSRLCVDKHKWVANTHPRGALGMKHTEQTKQKIAQQTKERMLDPDTKEKSISAMHCGRAEQIKSGGLSNNTYTRGRGGKRNDLNEMYFRSSWEANYARVLNQMILEGKIVSWLYEPKVFDISTNNLQMVYIPDFLLEFPDGKKEWHEVKGWLTEKSKIKLTQFAGLYPDEILILIDSKAYQVIAKQYKNNLLGWEQ